MRKINLVPTVLAFTVTSLTAQTNWSVDKSHSKVGFSVSHLVISEVEGYFKDYDAEIITKGDDFSTAVIDFTIDAKSIFSDNEMRDNHLRSDDFFNAEKFPKMIFKGKSLKKIAGDKYKLIGDLTIRDITKRVELDVEYNGIIKDPWGNTKAGFKITGEINRFDYNLKWNTTLETGGLVVGKEVDLNINLELVKKS
ncbi:MAG: YceI family protein [Bacteroidota bacterium]